MISSDKSNLKGVQLLSEICAHFDNSIYISGPNGRKYGVVEEFQMQKLLCKFHHFVHPFYEQNKIEFVPYLGFVDSLFRCGDVWLADFVRTKPEFVLT